MNFTVYLVYAPMKFLGSYKKRNLTGFVFEHPDFGKIFLGHFDPIHKEKNAHAQMKPIFAECNIVIGDLNSGWYRLTGRNKYNIVPLLQPGEFGHVYNPISYLPSVRPNPRDASIDMIISKYIQPVPIDVGVDFGRIADYSSPRDMMKDINFPSDHLPIKASLAGAGRIVVAFWNVADPIFWSQFYPDAMNGFTMAGENVRLNSIVEWVNRLLEGCDILGLAEVPISLIPKLQNLAGGREMQIKYTSEHSDIWRPNFPISQIVVMWR